MKWLIVEKRVWEVEAKDHEDALKVFEGSEASPPAETTLSSEDWWTRERCEELAELIRQSIEGRAGVCNDTYDSEEFEPWIKKAGKVVKKILGADLGVRELHGSEPEHDGRWMKMMKDGGREPHVGVFLLEGNDKNDETIELSLVVSEDVALKILVMGGF